MKYAKLSLEIRELLDNEAGTDEWIAVAQADIDREGNYSKIYLSLLKNELLYLQVDDAVQLVSKERFVFDQFDDPKILNETVGAVLTMRNRNGEDQIICRFSGSRMKEMNRLLENLKQITGGNPVDIPAHLADESEDYCDTCGRHYPDHGRKFCPHCMKKRHILLRLLGYFKPYRFRFALLLIMIGLTSALNALLPYLTGSLLYDEILGQNAAWFTEMEALGLPGTAAAWLFLLFITLAAVRLFQQLASIIHGRLAAYIVPGMVTSLKNTVFEALSRLSISFFTKRQTGSLMERVNGDAEEVSQFFIDGLPFFLFNILTIVGAAIIMFRMNVLLAVLSLVLLPPLFWVSYYLMPRIWYAYGRRSRANRRVWSVLNDALVGARVIRAFGQEERNNRSFEQVSSNLRNTEMNIVRYSNSFSVSYSIAEQLPVLFVWVVGAVLILQPGDGLMYGQLLTFSGYLAMMQGPIRFFSVFSQIYTLAMNSTQRMFEIADAKPEVMEADEPIYKEIQGDIELRGVSFSYDVNHPVLHNINLKIKGGESLGIVGKSGAGKSTLVNLIARLYDPTEGEILVDGINVRDLAFSSLRSAVSMVSQESYIFMGTIAENIAYGRPEASRRDIVSAAVAAGAHTFISGLPDGYDSLIGSGRRKLSGGERQRVSIARAILTNPKILVLDEATASVDTETERQIQASLTQLTANRSSLSIAHRLSTLRDVDRIIVLDNGRLVEEGTHEELLANSESEYYKLTKIQTEALAMRS